MVMLRERRREVMCLPLINKFLFLGIFCTFSWIRKCFVIIFIFAANMHRSAREIENCVQKCYLLLKKLFHCRNLTWLTAVYLSDWMLRYFFLDWNHKRERGWHAWFGVKIFFFDNFYPHLKLKLKKCVRKI